jgi:hypothetical protein
LWLKKKYFEAVNHTCQDCHQKERIDDKLQPHRIKQGNENGLYTIVPLNNLDNNIKVLHKSCHKKYHYNNYSWCKGK